MSRRPSARLAVALGIATAVACALPGLLSQLGARPSSVAVAVTLAFVPYALLFVHAEALDARKALHLALAAAGMAGLFLVSAQPVLSDDVYRYLWDGRVVTHGIDPYLYAPDHPSLAPLRDELWPRVNHREIPTIYPPLAQALFALSDTLGHTPHVWKALMLLAHLGSVLIVDRLAVQGRARAVLSFALNPLALSESALEGHVDALVGTLLALALWALLCARGFRAALCIAAATGLKLAGLLLLPLLARRRPWQALVAGVLALALLSPMLFGGGDDPSGAGHYARRWRGNDALFGLIEGGLERLIRGQADAEELARGHIRLDRLAPLLARAADTPLDPWATAVEPGKEIPDRADFEIPFLASLLARVTVVALVLMLMLALGLGLGGLSPLSAARVTLIAALWLAPQIHPWYLLWLLPIEAAAGGIGGLVWSASVLVAYAPIDLWQRARIWNEASLAKTCEFGLVLLVFALEAWLFKTDASVPHARLPILPDSSQRR
jgi:hypothetical protein